MPDLPIIPPSLPEGFCPSTWQELINEGVGKAIAKFEGSGFTAIINSESVPNPVDQDKLWYRPSTASRGMYRWFGGAWIIAHPEPAGGNARRLWTGTTTELQTYDGGDAGAPGANSGPMWEVDTAYNDRIPVGALLGGIADIEVNAGASNITLVDANLPLTSLKMFQSGANVSPGVQIGATDSCAVSASPVAGAEWNYEIQKSNIPASPPDIGVTSSFGQATPTPIDTIPQVRGTYFIKRTALRVNYVGS